MNAKFKSVINEVYHRFTIIEHLPPKKYGKKNYKQVQARCECGNIRDVDYRDLKRGKRKSCGCYSAEIKIDITENPIYDYWTILKEVNHHIDSNGNKSRKVLCRCKCGKEKEVILNSLRQGQSTSCGCKPKPTPVIVPRTLITPLDIDEVNKRDLGDWVIVEEVSAKREEKDNSIKRTVLMRCKCGHEKTVDYTCAKNSKSCVGCFAEKTKQETKEKHNTPEYKTKETLRGRYCCMRERCNNPNSKDYKNYGGRGIKVCSGWDTFEPFYNWCLNNGYEKGLELDRKENNKGYSPENCRFVTKTENNRNMRKNVMTVEIVQKIRTGEYSALTDTEISKILNCCSSTVRSVRTGKTWKEGTL